MIQKVLGSVFVLAAALGMISAALRHPATTPPAVPAPAAAKAGKPDISRPLASYRVREEGLVDGMNYQGADYTAAVFPAGVRFGGPAASVRFGTPVVEQGSTVVELTRPEFKRLAHGIARLERGAVTEEYVFENRRMEQLFRIAAPVGQGDLRIRIPVASEFGGTIETHAPNSGKFEDVRFLNGGVAFLDEKGLMKAAYYSAVALDADGRELAFAPRHENGEIILQVPGPWMANAKYPVVIDPWLSLNGSGVGGGISNTSSVSDRPSMALSGSGSPFLAWSDNSVGNYEVYVTYWNGFQFVDLGGASFGAGLSANKGNSVNPNIALDPLGIPYVAWEDDTEGRVGIYFKRWNGTAWEELTSSAQRGGLSTTFTGPAQHPQVAVIRSYVANTILPLFVFTPLLVWEEAGEIQAYWHYTGDDRIVPGQPGWYSFGAISIPAGPGGGSAGSPSLSVDSTGRPVVAWHDTVTNNYEIYVRRLQDNVNPNQPLVLTGAPAFTTVTRNPTGTFSTGSWVGIAGSDTGGGVSVTPTQLSQHPSVACDGNSIAVAWQETTPGGGTGTNNDIFAARSDGTGAFATLGNVSRSLGNSASPALAARNGTLACAWVEDPIATVANPSPNTEIYVRSFTVGTSTAWEQIGIQGSAGPLVAPDTIFSEGGISLSPNSSMFPAVKVDRFGSPTVVWADGATGRLDIRLKSFSPNGPGVMVPNGSTGLLDFVTTMRQTVDDPVLVPGTANVPVASPIQTTTIYFSANVFTETLIPVGSTLRLQVEVADSSAAFTGTGPDILEGYTNIPGSVVVVPFTGIVNRNYHWQARTIDQFGRYSPWEKFQTVGNVSFQINSAAPTSGVANNVPIVASSGQNSKGSCGLLGLDAVALLGVLGMIRRRRFSK